MPRQPSYKPLLFTTTIRSPERLKGFLAVLKDYDGKKLDDALAEEISGKIIGAGLYRPKNMSLRIREKIKNNRSLTEKEIKKILKNNPQNHKEAGFGKGWASRFDTWFKFAKELGFVFYQPGEKILFSTIGLKLVDMEHPEFEQQAFLNAFVKYQTNNPFRRTLNENVPLILLLEVITKLNADKEFNGAGISKLELPLVIYWKDGDSEKLYKRIKNLRNDFGYSPSWEVVIDICREEIMQGRDIVRDNHSIMTDYPDDFIRKMRLTGVISLRGGGRFIDINQNERKKVAYLLKKYSNYKKYSTEKSYFKYLSAVDEKLIDYKPKPVSTIEKDKFLTRWTGVYSWTSIKKEMLNLSKRRLSRDDTLKYLSEPIRLEFLTALAVKSKFPDIRVIPNYPVDDEGIPTSTAAGANNTGDIECFEGKNGILIEVTMSEGRTQTMMEVWPIGRHLEAFKTRTKNSICYFVAPGIFADSIKQINYLKDNDNLLIHPKTIKDFLNYLENNHVLYCTR